MEARLINRVLAEHGVRAYTHPVNVETRRPMIAKTPRYTIYGIDKYARGVKVADVRKLLPEVEAAIEKERNERTPVRFSANPPAFEVPRTDPTHLLLNEKSAAGLPKFVAPLGRSFAFFKKENVAINFAHPSEAHLLIAGTNGSGKSTATRVILATLARNASPQECQFVMVDPKNRGLVPFKDLPHTIYWGHDPVEGIKAIKWVHDEVVYRTSLDSVAGLPRLFLVLEELSYFAFDGARDVFDLWLPKIAVAGRELGVHIIAVAQKPDGGLIGSQLKSQLNVRLVGRLTNGNESYWATGQRDAGAEKLPGFAEFILVRATAHGTNHERISGFWIEPEALTTFNNATRSKWAGHGAVAININEVVTDSIDVVKLRNYELARPALERYYDKTTGKLRRGGKKAIIESIFGEGAFTGGSNNDMADAILAMYQENYKATTTADKS